MNRYSVGEIQSALDALHKEFVTCGLASDVRFKSPEIWFNSKKPENGCTLIFCTKPVTLTASFRSSFDAALESRGFSVRNAGPTQTYLRGVDHKSFFIRLMADRIEFHVRAAFSEAKAFSLSKKWRGILPR